jgi:hypothetical protein
LRLCLLFDLAKSGFFAGGKLILHWSADSEEVYSKERRLELFWLNKFGLFPWDLSKHIGIFVRMN